MSWFESLIVFTDGAIIYLPGSWIRSQMLCTDLPGLNHMHFVAQALSQQQVRFHLLSKAEMVFDLKEEPPRSRHYFCWHRCGMGSEVRHGVARPPRTTRQDSRSTNPDTLATRTECLFLGCLGSFEPSKRMDVRQLPSKPWETF